MNVRIFIFANIGAFWIAVFAIVSYGASKKEVKPNLGKDNGQTYSLSQVQEHSSHEDCWMAIDGKVYDFSDYIEQHPTKPQVMTEHCGTEASEAYATKGGLGRSHHPGVDEKLKKYEIGSLSGQN